MGGPPSRRYLTDARTPAAARSELPDTTTQEEVLTRVKMFNADPNINGILVQLPVPAPPCPPVGCESHLVER